MLVAPVVAVVGVANDGDAEIFLSFCTVGSPGILAAAPVVGVAAGVEIFVSLFSATCFCSGIGVVLVCSFDKAGDFGVAVSTTTLPSLLLGVVSVFFVSSIS